MLRPPRETALLRLPVVELADLVAADAPVFAFFAGLPDRFVADVERGLLLEDVSRVCEDLVRPPLALGLPRGGCGFDADAGFPDSVIKVSTAADVGVGGVYSLTSLLL